MHKNVQFAKYEKHMEKMLEKSVNNKKKTGNFYNLLKNQKLERNGKNHGNYSQNLKKKGKKMEKNGTIRQIWKTLEKSANNEKKNWKFL